MVTAVVATIGAYGIWQEWWIGTLWLSMFVILACRAAYPNATQLSHALKALDDYEHDKKDPRGEER